MILSLRPSGFVLSSLDVRPLAMLAFLDPRAHLDISIKKVLAAISGLLLVYIILDREATRSLWEVRGGSRIARLETQGYLAEWLDTPLAIDEWGLMGGRVRQLSQWADKCIKKRRKLGPHQAAFRYALLSQFPFLAGTEHQIYTPWSPVADTAFSSQTGFVVCTGSKNFHLAAHLIRSLRRVHHSQTPIEIAYAGDEDLIPKHRDFLQSLEADISFIDLLERFPKANHDLTSSGWAQKPFALLASSHQRAVLMDADAQFLTSPD